MGLIAYVGPIGTAYVPLALALGPAILLTVAIAGWTAQRLAGWYGADEQC